MRGTLPLHRRVVCAVLLAAALTGIMPSAEAADGWIGQWSSRDGATTLLAGIRRGTRDPSFLRVEIGVGVKDQCAGGITAYGKPEGNRLLVESYDPKDQEAPVCRLLLRQLPNGRIGIEEHSGECSYHHGLSCDFNGEVSRAKR